MQVALLKMDLSGQTGAGEPGDGSVCLRLLVWLVGFVFLIEG